MAYLIIDGKEYQARTDFKFERAANEKYNEADAEGNKQGGLITIYSNLLEYDVLYLSAFWDCALAHLKADKPSLDSIDNAITDHIEEHSDADQLFKDAFSKLDQSGFFKKKVKKFWKNADMVKSLLTTDQEMKSYDQMLEDMKEARKELTL